MFHSQKLCFQVAGTDLCLLSQDLSKKKFAKSSQGMKLKSEHLEKILDSLPVDKPEKMTKYNMCNVIWDFIHDHCPDRCLLLM